MNSSEYFAAFLHAVGIERAYTLSGGMIAPLLDAIGEHPQLKFVAVSHEQSAAFAAETEGQLGNKPGVAIGTSELVIGDLMCGRRSGLGLSCKGE